MPEPINFPSITPATGLPLLVPGQAQKEFFVNQALSVVDALLTRSVADSRSAPPAPLAAGACHRITAPASAAWTGHDDEIAVAVGGDWHFIAPAEGFQIFDRTAGHTLVFRDQQWRQAETPSLPAGGTTVDAEARAAIAALIDALGAVGILGPTPT